MVRLDDVFAQPIGIRIDAGIEMSRVRRAGDRRRRQRDLYGSLGERLHEAEIVDVHGAAPLQSVVDLQQRHGNVLPLVVDEEHALGLVVDGRAAEPPADEVGVEDAAAKLAVGDRPKTDLFLHGDRLANEVVLDAAQVGGRETSGVMVGASLQELGRPQQRADVLGPKRGIVRSRASHGGPPRRLIAEFVSGGRGTFERSNIGVERRARGPRSRREKDPP